MLTTNAYSAVPGGHKNYGEIQVTTQVVGFKKLRWFTYENLGDELLDMHAEGVPVGLLQARVYDEMSADLQAGDLVVLTSDGILDAMNEEGEEYGRERLGATIQTCCHLPVSEVVQAIYAAVQAFSGTAPQFDDQTVLILRVS